MTDDQREAIRVAIGIRPRHDLQSPPPGEVVALEPLPDWTRQAIWCEPAPLLNDLAILDGCGSAGLEVGMVLPYEAWGRLPVSWPPEAVFRADPSD